MTVIEITKQPKYLAVAIIVSLTVIAFAAWLPNLHLITKTMTSATMTLWQKTNLMTSLLGSLQTNFTAFSRVVTFISAGLVGIQVSLLAYYIRRTVKLQQSMGMSAIGIALSLLGVGCASCGSVLITSFIGFGATTTLLGFLPFRGQEFGFLGIGILLYAIQLTIKKINDPLVCGVKRKGGK